VPLKVSGSVVSSALKPIAACLCVHSALLRAIAIELCSGTPHSLLCCRSYFLSPDSPALLTTCMRQRCVCHPFATARCSRSDVDVFAARAECGCQWQGPQTQQLRHINVTSLSRYLALSLSRSLSLSLSLSLSRSRSRPFLPSLLSNSLSSTHYMYCWMFCAFTARLRPSLKPHC
jgi:hypothetical protein